MPEVIYVERKQGYGCGTMLLMLMAFLIVMAAINAAFRTPPPVQKTEEEVAEQRSVQLLQKWFDKDGNPTLVYFSKIGSAKKSYNDFRSACLDETVKHTETPFIGAALFDRKEDVVPPRGLVASGAYFTSEKDAKQPYAEYVGNPRNGSKEFQVNK